MNRLGVMLVLLLAIGLSVQVLASSTDWLWVITVSAQPGYSDSNQGKFGVLSVAFDEQDSKDVQANKTNTNSSSALCTRTGPWVAEITIHTGPAIYVRC